MQGQTLANSWVNNLSSWKQEPACTRQVHTRAACAREHSVHKNGARHLDSHPDGVVLSLHSERDSYRAIHPPSTSTIAPFM